MRGRWPTANEVEIRVTGDNDARPAFEQANQQMRQTGRQAGEMGQAFARAADRVQQAADRLAAAQIASRRATLAATEATERAERAQREAAQAAERLARGEIDQAEAARLAAHAERELERASIARATAQRAASQASARQVEHQRSLAGALGNTAAAADEGGRGLARLSATAGRASSGGGVATLAAVLGSLPTLAQLAAAGLTLGLGGAIAGLGLKAASMSEGVQTSFASLAEYVKARSSDMAKPFERTLTDMSGFARRTFDSLAPHLERSWAQLAPATSRFADSFAQGLERLGPVIDDVTAEMVPLMDAIGAELPDLMGRTADAISRVVRATDPEMIANMVEGTGRLITVLGHGVEILAHFGSGLNKIYQASERVLTSLGLVSDDAWETGSSMNFAAEGADVAASGFSAMGAAMGLASVDAGKLQDAMDELAGNTLDARGAARAYEAAIDDARDSVREHGRTLDVNTAKGRANQEALDRIARAALAKRDAMQKARRSTQDIDRAMSHARSQFVRTAVSMGQSRAAANRLADSIFGVKRQVDRLPRAKRITITANTAQARAMFNALIGDISRRTVTVGVSLGFLGGFGFVGRAHGGIIGAQGVGSAQGGGPRGSWTLVGEQGPELVDLPYGSRVTPAGQTRSMMAAASGPQSGPIHIALSIGDRAIGEVIIDPLRKAISSRGGNVQAALGQPGR